MKASLRSLSKPVHALPSCTNSIKHAFPSLFQVDPSPHTQCFTHASRQTAYACVGPPKPLPNTHIHTQSPLPKPKPLPILPIVQCSPFQPGLHSHFPSLQVPCSLQRGWHALWSHPVPIQPSSQRQLPDTQTPWPPQSAAQISVGDRDIETDKKREWGKTDRKEGRGLDGKGRQGGDGTRWQGWRKNKSKSYCQGKAATLHYLVWWQLKRNSCTSYGPILFDNTNLISPLQRKDMDCGGLSILILLLASSPLCKVTSFSHTGGKEEKINSWNLL